MDNHRGSFIAGIVLGAGLGLLLGHFTLWRPASPVVPVVSSPYFESSTLALLPGLSGSAGLTSIPAPESLQPIGPGSEVWAPDRMIEEDSGELQNALAMEASAEPGSLASNGAILTESRQTAAGQTAEPKALPYSAASPLPGNSPQDQQTIRAIVDLELPHLSTEQRDVWFDALKDVNKEDVAGILKMWKMLGAPIPETPRLTNSPEPAPGNAPHAPDLPVKKVPLPVDSFHSPLGVPPESAHSFTPPPAVSSSAPARSSSKVSASGGDSPLAQQFTQVLRQNALMSRTPGYVPLRPHLVAISSDRGEPEYRLEVLPQFDQTTSLATGMPLDVCLRGTGFFQVQNGDGHRYLTRYGRFELDSDRRLRLSIAGQNYQLVPEVRLPEFSPEKTELQIDAAGLIILINVVNDAVIEPTPRLSAWIPASGASLQHVSNGLFRIDEQAVLLPAVGLDDPEAGATFQAGALEIPAGESPSLEDIRDLMNIPN